MFKKSFVPLMLCVSCALLLAACGGAGTNSNATTTNTSTTNTSTTGTTTPTTTSSPATSGPATTTPASGEKIGIAECDEFIEKYDACISNKVPETARAQYKSSIEQWRSSWRKMAANPATKSTLASVCKTTVEQARASMQSFGCDF